MSLFEEGELVLCVCEDNEFFQELVYIHEYDGFDNSYLVHPEPQEDYDEDSSCTEWTNEYDLIGYNAATKELTISEEYDGTLPKKGDSILHIGLMSPFTSPGIRYIDMGMHPGLAVGDWWLRGVCKVEDES